MSALPELGAVVAGKYRVDGELGRGAMGVVYAATHLVTGSSLALKWLSAGSDSPVQRARLFREAQAAGRVQHPNVVRVHDVGQHGDAVFLVMERLVGQSLGDALEGSPPLSVRDAVRLLMPAMRAVAAAHAAGVIHRDLKPDNLFLAEDANGQSSLKVLDFGISKVDNAPELMLTQTGVVLGTPLYMAPEQLKGRLLDGRCDQYALACILFELVEGESPFQADSFAELAAAKLRGKPRAFRTQTPARFRAAISRALATDPEDRFPNVVAFAAALEPVAEGVRFRDDADTSGLFPSSRSAPELDPAALAAATTTMASPRTIDESLRRRWRASLIALGLIITLGIAAGWALRGSDPIVADEVNPPAGTPEDSLAIPTQEPIASREEPIASREVAPEGTFPTSIGTEGHDSADDEGAVDGASEDEESTMRRRSPPRVRHRTGGVSLGDF